MVDTASSLGQAGDKGFFKNQAQVHIARALEALREIRADVTLENAYHLLIDERDLQGVLPRLDVDMASKLLGINDKQIYFRCKDFGA